MASGSPAFHDMSEGEPLSQSKINNRQVPLLTETHRVFRSEQYKNGDSYEGEMLSEMEPELATTNGEVDFRNTAKKNRSVHFIKDGVGTYSFSNGSVYQGKWKNGTMHGWGIFTEAVTKDKYEGQWEKGRRTVGAYHYSNGNQYHGAFGSDGCSKHGRGIVWDKGRMFEVVYQNDKLTSKVPFDTSVMTLGPILERTAPATLSPSNKNKLRQQAIHNSMDTGNSNVTVIRKTETGDRNHHSISSPSPKRGASPPLKNLPLALPPRSTNNTSAVSGRQGRKMPSSVTPKSRRNLGDSAKPKANTRATTPLASRPKAVANQVTDTPLHPSGTSTNETQMKMKEVQRVLMNTHTRALSNQQVAAAKEVMKRRSRSASVEEKRRCGTLLLAEDQDLKLADKRLLRDALRYYNH